VDDVLSSCCNLHKTCTAKNEPKTRALALPAWFQVELSLVVRRVSQLGTVRLGRWRSYVPLGRGISGARVPRRAKASWLYLLEGGGGEEVSYIRCF